MVILSFTPGLIVFLFFHSLKFVKCRRCLLSYRAAVSKSRGLSFMVPFKYLKIVSTELCTRVNNLRLSSLS